MADQPALLALDPATYAGRSVTVASLNYSSWTSNGTAFFPTNGSYVHETNQIEGVRYTAPNTGITWTVADNGSGLVRATSSGPHGLTTTPAVGSSLCVKTTQNGWTAGDFIPILTVVDANNIDLNTPITGKGVPVFNMAQSSDFATLITITLPILRANTEVMIEMNERYSGTTGGNKITRLNLDGNSMMQNAYNSAAVNVPYRIGFRNRNNVSSQIGLFGASSVGFGTGTEASTATVNTGVAGTILTVVSYHVEVNAFQQVMNYSVTIKG